MSAAEGQKRRAKKSLLNYVFPPSEAQLHSLTKLTGKQQLKLRRRSDVLLSGADKQQSAREAIDRTTQSHPGHPSITIPTDTFGLTPGLKDPYVLLSKLPQLDEISLLSTTKINGKSTAADHCHNGSFSPNNDATVSERTESTVEFANTTDKPISSSGGYCDYDVIAISPPPQLSSMPQIVRTTPLSDSSDTSEELDSSTSCLALGKRDLSDTNIIYSTTVRSSSALSDVSDGPSDETALNSRSDMFYATGANGRFSLLKSTLSDDCDDTDEAESTVVDEDFSAKLIIDQSNLPDDSVEGSCSDQPQSISPELITPAGPIKQIESNGEVFDDRYEEIAQGDVQFTDECPLPPVLAINPRRHSSSSHSSETDTTMNICCAIDTLRTHPDAQQTSPQEQHQTERICDSRGSSEEFKLLLILDDSDESNDESDAVDEPMASSNDLQQQHQLEQLKQENSDNSDDLDLEIVEDFGEIRSQFVSRHSFPTQSHLYRSASASDTRSSSNDPTQLDVDQMANVTMASTPPHLSSSETPQRRSGPNLLRKSNSTQHDYSGIKSLLMAPSRHQMGPIHYGSLSPQLPAEHQRMLVDRCGSDGCLTSLSSSQPPRNGFMPMAGNSYVSTVKREDRRGAGESSCTAGDPEAEAAVNALLSSQVGTGERIMVASDYDDFRMSSAAAVKLERPGTTSLYSSTTTDAPTLKAETPPVSPSIRHFTSLAATATSSSSAVMPLRRNSPPGGSLKSLPANIEVSVVGSPFVYGAELGGIGAGVAPDERLIQKHPVNSQTPPDSPERPAIPPTQLLTVDPTPLVMSSGVPPISPLLSVTAGVPLLTPVDVESDDTCRRTSIEGRGDNLRPSPASSVSTASPDLPGKRRTSISCHIAQPPKKRFYYSRDGEGGSHQGELSGNDSSRPVSVDNGGHQADSLDQPLKVQSAVAVVAPQAPNAVATLKTFDLTGRTSVETVAYGHHQAKPLQQVAFADRPVGKFPTADPLVRTNRLTSAANSIPMTGVNGSGPNGHLSYQQSPQKPFNSAMYDTFMTSSHPLSSSAQSARYPSVPLGAAGTSLVPGRWPTPNAPPKGSFTPFNTSGAYANGSDSPVVSANGSGSSGANGSSNLAQQYYVIQEIRNLPQGECFQLALSAWEWLTLDGCRLPCVFRNREKYLAVHMVQMRLLAKFPPNVPTEIMRKHRMISHKMTVLEAWILNNEIVSAADVEKFYWSVKAFNLSRMNEIYRSEIRANSELHLVLAAHISQLKNHCEAEIRAIERHQLSIENGSGHTLTPLTPAVSHQPPPPQALMPAGPDPYGRGRSGPVAGSPQIHHQKSPTMTAASYIYQQQQAVAGMYPHMLPQFRNFENISPPTVFQQFSAAMGVGNGPESRPFPYGAAAQSLFELTGRYPPGNGQYPNGLPPSGSGNLRLT